MRVLALIVVAAVAAAGVAIAYGAGERAGSRASIRLVRMQPLVVSGTGFQAREQVRVTVHAKVTRSERATASPSGSFRATFADVPVGRCDRLRVIAIGKRGSRAVLKRFPLPACLPA